MKIVLVSSQINYVRDNYRYLLEKILEEKAPHICALILIQNLDLKLILKALSLMLIGCPRLGSILLKNCLKNFTSNPFRKFKKLKIPILQTQNINNTSTQAFLKSLQPDLIINLRTRNIYRKEVLSIPKLGSINIHHGILPTYRGTMCDLWALKEARPVGFSVHWMNTKVDDGDILAIYEHPKLDTKDYSQIPYLSSKREADILLEILSKMEKGEKLTTRPNQCDTKIYSRNPDLKQIREIRKQGIQL